MRKKNTISRQRTLELLQEEITIFKIEETVAPQLRRAKAQRTDFDSLVIKNLLEKRLGRRINDPRLIDEGMWEKAKHMLSKLKRMKLGKGGGAAAGKEEELQAALDAAADQKFNELWNSFKSNPAMEDFPNNESEQEFGAGVTGLYVLYSAVDAAHKQGTIETDHANDLVAKIKSYTDGLNKDLSYSYRYLKEEEDEINEISIGAGGGIRGTKADIDLIDLNRLTKLANDLPYTGNLDQLQQGMSTVDPKIYKKLEKKATRIMSRLGHGDSPKEKEAVALFKSLGIVDDNNNVVGVDDWEATNVDPDIPPEVDPETIPPDPDPVDPDEPPGPDEPPEEPCRPGIDPGCEGPVEGPPGGCPAGTYFQGPTGKCVPEAPSIGGGGGPLGHKGLGATGLDPGSMARLYAQAGSAKGLLSYLGGNAFLVNAAGFALPVAAIGGIVGMVAKRALGHSREGALKKISKMMVDLDRAEHGTTAPTPPPERELEPEPDSEVAPGGEGIFIYRGKRGKGLQSTLDKAGIPGNIKSLVLKHIAGQLQKQGLTVQELKQAGFPEHLLVEVFGAATLGGLARGGLKGAAIGAAGWAGKKALGAAGSWLKGKRKPEEEEEEEEVTTEPGDATVPPPDDATVPPPDDATVPPPGEGEAGPEGTQAGLQRKRAGTSGAPQVAVYNHPAGKEHSLSQALQDAGYTGEDLGQLMDMIAAWGKAQGLKINEDIFRGILDDVLVEARMARWKQLLRG